ncbi:hypothetical protein BGZ81_006312 [Podila clonocystis]|nr:hypothetical protein BGZ81_006312 [Podila clonocystis]
MDNFPHLKICVLDNERRNWKSNDELCEKDPADSSDVTPMVLSGEGHVTRTVNAILVAATAKDLVSCTRACRTWYNVLTPLLWRYFDDRERYLFKVPLPLLQAKSHHFRYLSLTTSKVSLAPTLLHELVIDGLALAANVDLLPKNPQLASLRLHLEDDAEYQKIRFALDTTTRLRTLHISCNKCPNIDHLIEFIGKNTQLRDLEIGDIMGVGLFDMTTPLMHLTELRLNTFLDTNSGLVDLIRHSPNLEVLWFQARFGCPAKIIARNIHECCPHLMSIRCLNGTSFRDASWLLCDDEILLLMSSTSRLVHFEMEMLEFTSEVCDALLLAHAQHLETVHIYVDGMDRATLVHGGKVLAACSNIKSFALICACNAWSPKDGLILLEQPWKSPVMEAFWLDGIFYNGESEDVDGDYEDFFEPDPDDLEKERDSGAGMNRGTERETEKILSRYGWTQVGRTCSEDHDSLGSRYGNKLLRSLLQRVVVKYVEG